MTSERRMGACLRGLNCLSERRSTVETFAMVEGELPRPVRSRTAPSRHRSGDSSALSVWEGKFDG